MSRREYMVNIVVNEIKISQVIIDPHYEEKHASTITDEIILELVKQFDGKVFDFQIIKGGYTYFEVDKLELQGKFYKLIWVLEKDKMYIGVINAYRR